MGHFDMYLTVLNFFIDNNNISVEGSVSHIFYLCICFYFIINKTGNFWSFFNTFFSRLHKL